MYAQEIEAIEADPHGAPDTALTGEEPPVGIKG